MNEITLINPPPGVTAADYAAIEDAVMETARGRWFLLEYARRQRAAETQRLADAVDRLEDAIASMAPGLAAARPPSGPEPEPEPANETAAAVAEKLSDIVWTMRERGVGDQFCAELEKQIRVIRSLRTELQSTQETPAFLPLAGSRLQDPAPQAENAARVLPTARDILALPPRVESEPAPAVDPRVVALSHLDALPLVEKLALFC